MLELKSVTFGYGNASDYWFDLTVKPGEIVGVSGASGAGKSTLLDIISGFLTPKSGQIVLNGKNIESLQVEDRPVSILFQKHNIFPHLTAEQNVKLGKKHVNDVTQSLKEVGLADFAAQKCENLSGGQQQRVALARTLIRDMPVLLLDEPFAALDEATAKNARALVKKLVKKHQWHTILVSHQQADFSALANRVLRLEDGKLSN